MNKILTINPGSTSTKIALFNNEQIFFYRVIEHSEEELSQYKELFDQMDFRLRILKGALREAKVDPETVTAIAARGGLLPPVKAGAYRVTPEMIALLRHRPTLEHASNLGAPLAYALGDPYDIPCYIYDPVTVDEMLPLHKITGLSCFRRRALGHNLNMRAMAHRYAASRNIPYADLNLIVVHLGTGITLTLHQKGRITDMINDEEGPFSPERAGGLPNLQLIDLAFSGKYDKKSLTRLVKTEGGLMSHLGTKDARVIEERIKAGDEKADLVYKAMALDVSRWVGALAVDVCGDVDAIILTGGIAYSNYLTEIIKNYISFIAPVIIYEGEDELKALAEGILRVLRGEEEVNSLQI